MGAAHSFEEKIESNPCHFSTRTDEIAGRPLAHWATRLETQTNLAAVNHDDDRIAYFETIFCASASLPYTELRVGEIGWSYRRESRAGETQLKAGGRPSLFSPLLLVASLSRRLSSLFVNSVV
jgi:hypothetical protein